MNKTDKFIELYKKLEDTVRDVYGLKMEDSISYYLTKHTKYSRNRNEIRYCQNVRNLLQHNEKIDRSFPVEPSNDMIAFIEYLIKDVASRQTCNDISIKLKDIYFRSMEDTITDSMKLMRDNSFTYVPILKDGVVQGIFDENAIFNYLADSEIITVDGAIFEDLKQYLSLYNRELVQFDFVSPDTYVDDLYKLFKHKLNTGTRLGMIFITPSGKATERITGIITPWDILGKEK